MLHKVVKPFPFAADGVTLVDLDVGDERDFGGLADGLMAEGWVEAGEDAEPAVEPVAPVAEPVAAQVEPVVTAEPEPAVEPEKPAKKVK
jgi:hypothetical protein